MEIFLKIRYHKCCINELILLRVTNSKTSMIFRYWFSNHGFNFQDYVCNDCHDLTILSVNISDIAIITFKNVGYLCIVHNITKSEAINLLKISVLKDRGHI